MPPAPVTRGKRRRAAEAPGESADLPHKGVKPRDNPPLPVTRPASLGSLFAKLTAPEPVLRIEIVRILAPLATLGFMSSRLRHADEWLSGVGFQVPEIPGSDWRQPLYLSPLSPTAAWALAAILVLSGLATAAGYRARTSAAIFAGTLAYVALADRLAAFTVSKLAPVVMLALAASPCGLRFGVDAWRRRRDDPEAPLAESVAAGGPRFFQILLPVFYNGSAMAKARGDWLKEPLVLWTHVHDSYQTAFSWALANALPGSLWTVLQGLTLALEMGAPIWFAWRRTRPVALALAVGMHAMIGLMFWPVRWFSLLMIAMLLGAFLPEGWLTRAAERVRRA